MSDPVLVPNPSEARDTDHHHVHADIFHTPSVRDLPTHMSHLMCIIDHISAQRERSTYVHTHISYPAGSFHKPPPPPLS